MSFSQNENTTIPLELPCGRCIGCRIARSKEWAVRCMHEASLHQENCFLTLTYDDDHMPDDGGLKKEHFQKFMKRLRWKYRHHPPIKYYMAGEYGTGPNDTLGRPHFHALIFGLDFGDKYLWNEQRKLYRSEELERLWPFGYSSIGAVNYKTSAYVARYVMKKITGEQAENHYRKVNPETGEEFKVIPEYNAMSLNPPIAKEWYEKYKADVFPHDYVVIDGRKVKTPKFYLNQLEAQDPEAFKDVKCRRLEYAKQNPESKRIRENRHINAKANLNRTKRILT